MMKKLLLITFCVIVTLLTVNSAIAIPATLTDSKVFASTDGMDREMHIYNDLAGNSFIIGHNVTTVCSIGTYDSSAFTFSVQEWTNGTGPRFTDCDLTGATRVIVEGSGEFYYGRDSLRNTTFSTTAFTSIGNAYGADDIDCSVFEYSPSSSRDGALTDDFFITLKSAGNQFEMCDTGIPVYIPPSPNTTAPLFEVETVDASTNRVGSYNDTHMIMFELDSSNNIDFMMSAPGDGCSQAHQGGSTPIDIYGLNGWIFALDANGQEIHVYNGLNCNYEDTATLNTQKCDSDSRSSSHDIFFVDDQGIHCITNSTGISKQVLKYDVDWTFPTVGPTTGTVDATCTFPCAFNETFNYGPDTACDHGWDPTPSTDCDDADVNGTHLVCTDNFAISRSFSAIAGDNTFAVLSYQLNVRDNSTVYVDLFGDGPLPEHSVGITYHPLTTEILVQGEQIGTYTTDVAHNYTVTVNLDTETYTVEQDGVTLGSGLDFADPGTSEIGQFYIGSSGIGLTGCSWDMNFVRLDVIQTPGARPPALNQSDGAFIRNEVTGNVILSLDPKNAFFDSDEADCGEQNINFCFLSTVGGAIGNAITNFLLGNLLTILVIAVLATLIGLVVSGRIL